MKAKAYVNTKNATSVAGVVVCGICADNQQESPRNDLVGRENTIIMDTPYEGMYYQDQFEW